MSFLIDEMVGQRLLLAFKGKERIPEEFVEALRRYKPAGITLFRPFNVDTPAQVRRLTAMLQETARAIGLPPFLIAADQEGGQLMAIGEGTTQLPGNMALGATGDPELARAAGEVLGTELRAMGINVNYAPCCDVNINPRNPVIGIRSFGEDPQQVSMMAAAMVEGIQSRGVAACAKHFPGHGDTAGDSHHGLPTLPHDLDRLQRVELPPFRAAVAVGAKLVMTGHLALPAIDGADAPPATLSAGVLEGLLREQIGFQGVIVTDAMDMHAIPQGAALGQNAVRAVEAGADLLLVMSEPADQKCIFDALIEAAARSPSTQEDYQPSLERIAALKRWLASQPPAPGLDVIGSLPHQAIADEIAQRSITLVCDETRLLPLRLGADARVAAVVPRPADLTPADTSSHVAPTLAASLREFHPRVDEIVVSSLPTEAEIAGLIQQVRGYDLIVMGTLNASSQPGQSALANAVLKTGIPTVVVAMRLPYDLTALPSAKTYVCTYSVLEPSMHALARALFGANAFEGKLPVSIPGLYSIGFGLV